MKNYRQRNFKPSKAQVQQWLQDCEEFKTQIAVIEEEFNKNHDDNLSIIINKKCNSIYFTFQDIDYRISTHKSEPTHQIGGQNYNGSGYKIPENSINTNSKKKYN